MDGYAAPREIRKWEGGMRINSGKDANLKSEIKGIPIIAMTADAMSGVKEKVLEVGMNDYITKPINPGELLKTLVKWIAPGERKVPEEPRNIQTEMQTLSDQLTLDLPGFDVDGALARMGGKVPAYIKILGKVLETEANAMERIQQSLNDGDSEAAIRGAHTLKGLSGNIGATVLHSVAADLEAALLDGDEVRSAPLLSQTAQSLDETLDIIKTALSNSEAETPPARATTSSVVIPEPLINQLRKQIDEFDSSAPETSDALHAELRGTEYEALASRLAKALDAYDFDQAQELIEALSQHIANTKGVLSESE
jgi:polar amino acid transport system substrate-binding protein